MGQKEDHLLFFRQPLRLSPRYGYGKPPHSRLFKLIAGRRALYRRTLKRFLKFREDLARIPKRRAPGSEGAVWCDQWLPGLDAVSLYGFLSLENPKRYVEIGSGYSTRFARQAVRDQGLRTEIISLDPEPRIPVDAVCDRVIRRPVEEVDVALFEEMEPGDILFLDGSHRVLMNSDATVFFLEILPRLRPGVLVQVHDVFLPLDYPPRWADRYYSEQYLLAVHLLAGGDRCDILLANAFIHEDPRLKRILLPLWSHPRMKGVGHHGGSFWFRTC